MFPVVQPVIMMIMPPNLMPLSPLLSDYQLNAITVHKTPVYMTCACRSRALPGSMVIFQLLQLLEVMLCLFEGIQLIVSQDPLVKILQHTTLH